MNEYDQLRVHHILCTSNYEGNGYSGAFCENMTKIVNRLREDPDEKLELVAHPDMICLNCPNKTESDTCMHDFNRVVEKDRFIAEKLGLTEGNVYTYRALCRKTREQMTEEMFTELCGRCDWKKQGLCRYEDFIAQLEKCIYSE